MTDGTYVPIAKAKGRPMLQWVGKRPLCEVRSFPAQLVERFAPAAPAGAASAEVDWSGWPDRFDRGGLLFHGDNKEVLAHLLANGFRGAVDLVDIDPPFDSGADYVRKVQLRGASGSVRLDGESHTLGEQIQYTDIWANDTYLQCMYERLLLIRELFSRTGTIYLHCDTHRGHQLRLDGAVFNVAQADIPERRQDLVSGSYGVARPAGSNLPVGVRITDLLGEDVLVIESRG